MKKFLFVLLALTMIVSLCAGCSSPNTAASTAAAAVTEVSAAGTEAPAAVTEAPAATAAVPVKDTLVVGVSSDTNNYFNTMDSADPLMNLAVNAMYDSLMYAEHTFDELQPRLATAYQVSEDGLTITFTLRDDVKFQNGDPFTSADVAATFEVAKTNAWQEAVWDYITSIEAPDAVTVVFHLSQYSSTALWKLAGFKMLPSAVITEKGIEWLDQNPIGTGPYKYVSYTAGVGLEMEANPEYYRDAPAIKHIKVDIIPDETTLSIALQNGDVDFAIINAAMKATLDGQPGLVVANAPTVRLAFMQLNTETLSLPLRKAIAYATDRAFMLEVASAGVGNIAGTIPINSNVNGYTTEGAVDYTYNLDKAREMVAEAGVQTPYNIGTIKGYTSAREQKDAEILQASLAEIGLTADIEISDYGKFEAEVKAGDFTIAIQGSSYEDYIGTLTYGSLYESRFINDTNYARYNNPAMDELFAQIDVAKDTATYNDLCRQIIQLQQEEVPYVMLHEMAVLDAYNENLNVVLRVENNFYLGEFSWKN